jgi:hypothetical protein
MPRILRYVQARVHSDLALFERVEETVGESSQDGATYRAMRLRVDGLVAENYPDKPIQVFD